MNKERKNRLFTTIVTLLLLISIIPLITNTVSAQTIDDYIDSGMCGDKVWISGSAYTPLTYANLYFENETGGFPDYTKRFKIDADGEFNVTFNVPYRSAIGFYEIRIFDNVSALYDGNDNITADFDYIDFEITDIYKVEIDPEIIYWDDTEPQDFTISIYNWTGSSYTLLLESIRYYLYDPEGTDLINDTMNIGTILTDSMFNWSSGAPYNNREADYLLTITNTTDENDIYASIPVPVRFHMIEFTPTSATYGDSVTIQGRVIDGGDDYVVGIPIMVVDPNNNMAISPAVTTTSTGRFSIAIDFDTAGTWYVGTYIPQAGVYRPEDEDVNQTVDGFIWYQTIEVDPSTGSIEVSPDTTTYGFEVEFEITCYDEDGDELENAYVYLTGVDCNYSGIGYDKDNIIYIGMTNSDGIVYINNSDGIDPHPLIFNNTGTAKFMFTYPGDWGTYDSSDPWDDEFDEDLYPNIYAEETVSVGSPAAMNVFINYEGEDRVLLGLVPYDELNDPADPPTIDEEWGNWSAILHVDVYGKTNKDRKNATVTIIGCGLDLEYDEDEYVTPGEYEFIISPRKAGTLIVTVTNGSLSATEDLEIDGLDADVTTSVGDDRYITVDKNETIYFTTNTHYAEVHALLYDLDWVYVMTLNSTIGDNKEGNGKDGTYAFYPDVSMLGYIVISAREGYGTAEDETNFYGFDIIEIVPEYDLVVTVIEPTAENNTLTAGLTYDIIVEITNLTGYELDYADIDEVTIELLDYEMEVIPDMFADETEDSDLLTHDEDNIWMYEDWKPLSNGTVRITVKAWEQKHQGNNTDIYVDWATFEYNPIKLTAGIGDEDIGVEVIAYDALGNIITEEFFEMYNDSDVAVADMIDPCDDWSGNSTGYVELDEDGMALLWINSVGDCTGYYYAKLNDVNTSGKLYVDYPDFEITPTIIYVGIVNEVEVIAKDWAGNLLEGVNITFWPSIAGALAAVPDPVMTDENGWATLSLEPVATGTLNLSLARDLHYINGQLNWTNLLTNATLVVTTKKPLSVTASKSPVYQGDTLTVTVTSGGDAVKDVNIKFGTLTGKTDAAGKVDFTVPDPGVDSALYYIIAEKTGYITETIGITVIKKYAITLVTPDEVFAGESFTVTVTAKGQPLAGATVTLDSTTTKTSDGEGKVTFTAGAKGATHTIKATYSPYTDATVTIGPVKEKGTPGFELLTLIIAIGVAFILLRRRKQN